MRELKMLGDLLGMPNVFDPSFPMAYSTFFGAAEASVRMDTSTTSSPNVSAPSIIFYYSGIELNCFSGC